MPRLPAAAGVRVTMLRGIWHAVLDVLQGYQTGRGGGGVPAITAAQKAIARALRS